MPKCESCHCQVENCICPKSESSIEDIKNALRASQKAPRLIGSDQTPCSATDNLLDKLWPDFLEWIADYCGDKETAALAPYSREDMRYAYKAGYRACQIGK